MANYTHLGNNIYVGLVTDTKPTAASTAAGAILHEFATDYSYHTVYINSGTAWIPKENEGPYSYLIYKTGSTIKAMNTVTKAILSSGTTADVVIQAAIDAVGTATGKAIYIKNGLYTLTAALNFTTPTGYVHITGESSYGAQLRPSGDFPAININKPNVTLDHLWFTHNQPAYTKSLLTIGGTGSSATTAQISMYDIGFYDFGNHTGNALGFDGTTVATDMSKIQVINCLMYGFNNSVYVDCGASPRFVQDVVFNACQFYQPDNAALAVNIASAGQFSNVDFVSCRVQCKTTAPNQTNCGFDYQTNNSGGCYYQHHFGNMVWDVGTGTNYANLNSQTQINLVACHPDWLIGGTIAPSFLKTFSTNTVGRGKSTQSGNASTKIFNIAHGLLAAPTRANVTAGSSDATGTPAVTFDATNVIVTYPIAPPSGTNNLVLNWEASVF